MAKNKKKTKKEELSELDTSESTQVDSTEEVEAATEEKPKEIQVEKEDPRNQGYNGIEDWFGRNKEFVECSTPYQVMIKFCNDFQLSKILACDMTNLSPISDPYVICNKLLKRGK